MAPSVTRVRSDDALPGHTHVVVIGGGIIGASTALFLARRGIRVLLCEKGEIGAEQSSRNWGWCREMGRDPAEIPLSVESLRLWGEMNETVEAEIGFRRSGIVYLCEHRRDLEEYENRSEQMRAHQLDSHMISSHAIDRLLPGAVRRWPGALYTPSDGRAEPQLATQATAEAARRRGVGLLIRCAVHGIKTAAGWVAAAVTQRGAVSCDAAVLAEGAWARLVSGDVPIVDPRPFDLARFRRSRGRAMAQGRIQEADSHSESLPGRLQ